MNIHKSLTVITFSALMVPFANAGISMPEVEPLENVDPQQNESAAEYKDILIEQQDIYTISPGNGQSNQSSSQSAASANPPVSIWVNHKNNTYAFGDQIVISAKAKSDGYLTIIDVGTSGKIRQLFPNKYQRDNRVRKGDVIKIPADNANYRYTVTGPAGTELIKAFLTENQANIYGKAESSFNDDLFPLTSTNSKSLRKDIITQLNNNSTGRWGVYNKVIRIIASSGSNTGQSQSQAQAAQAERALHLNSAQIRDIQRYLRKEGYYKGKIDGAIGKQTRTAIRNWQRAMGMNATGYIDAASFTAIMG